jgi:hypothetical protein
MAGQQAIAGLQERQQAQQALAQMLMQQRQQELQAALGSRQNAISAYGGVTPEGSFLDKWGGAISGAAAIAAKKSDRRLKTDIKPGDARANEALEGLKAYVYRYKDPKRYGDGEQLGVMAQDLEDAGLDHVVREGPDGMKQLDGAELAATNTAMLAALARRVSKLEGKKPAPEEEAAEEMDMGEEDKPGISVIEVGMMKPSKPKKAA